MTTTRRFRRLGLALILLCLTASGAARGGDHILAASWQPAFCETRPDKPECQTQTADRFDADHFSLHGLWPQPYGTFYCGVPDRLRAADRAGRWASLPPLDLDPELRDRLTRAMPGTRSSLDRHEWIKHGTCHPGSVETYYRESLALLDALNDSPLRALFVAHIDRWLDADTIREAADAAFGPGGGARVEVICVDDGPRRLIVALRLHLRGEIGDAPDLGRLLKAAPRARARCDGGMVDRVGLRE